MFNQGSNGTEGSNGTDGSKMDNAAGFRAARHLQAASHEWRSAAAALRDVKQLGTSRPLIVAAARAFADALSDTAPFGVVSGGHWNLSPPTKALIKLATVSAFAAARARNLQAVQRRHQRHEQRMQKRLQKHREQQALRSKFRQLKHTQVEKEAAIAEQELDTVNRLLTRAHKTCIRWKTYLSGTTPEPMGSAMRIRTKCILLHEHKRHISRKLKKLHKLRHPALTPSFCVHTSH